MPQTKSPDRLRVESVLMTATEDQPLSSAQIAKAAEVTIHYARAVIGHSVGAGVAINIGCRGHSLYVWGPPLPKPSVNGPRHVPHGTFTGMKPITVRAGAMDAFTLKSIQGGAEVERKAPMLIGSRVTGVTR